MRKWKRERKRLIEREKESMRERTWESEREREKKILVPVYTRQNCLIMKLRDIFPYHRLVVSPAPQWRPQGRTSPPQVPKGPRLCPPSVSCDAWHPRNQWCQKWTCPGILCPCISRVYRDQMQPGTCRIKSGGREKKWKFIW